MNTIYEAEKAIVGIVENGKVDATVKQLTERITANLTTDENGQKGRVNIGTFPYNESETLVFALGHGRSYDKAQSSVWQYIAQNNPAAIGVPLDVQKWYDSLSQRDADDMSDSFEIAITTTLRPTEVQYFKCHFAVDPKGKVTLGSTKPTKVEL